MAGGREAPSTTAPIGRPRSLTELSLRLGSPTSSSGWSRAGPSPTSSGDCCPSLSFAPFCLTVLAKIRLGEDLLRRSPLAALRAISGSRVASIPTVTRRCFTPTRYCATLTAIPPPRSPSPNPGRSSSNTIVSALPLGSANLPTLALAHFMAALPGGDLVFPCGDVHPQRRPSDVGAVVRPSDHGDIKANRQWCADLRLRLEPTASQKLG